MRAGSPAVVMAVLALALLAGCSQPATVPEGVPVGQAGEALPNLEGFVVDAALRPLEGVRVSILFSDTNATTDADGHYAIVRPTTQAEHVLLSAFLPGFIPLTQQVQITGYRSTRMDFRLEHDPRQVPRVDVLGFRGVLGCQATVGGTAWTCDPPSVTLDGIQPSPTTVVWPIALDFYVQGALIELHWDAESALAQTLHATLRGPVVGCCDDGGAGSKGEELARVAGTSPLRLELTQEQAQTFPTWSELWLEVDLPDGLDDVGVSRGQVFDAYAAVFYVEPAPAGYAFQ